MGQSMSSKSSSVFDFFLLRVNWLFLLCLQDLRNEDENGKINQMKVERQNVLKEGGDHDHLARHAGVRGEAPGSDSIFRFSCKLYKLYKLCKLCKLYKLYKLCAFLKWRANRVRKYRLIEARRNLDSEFWCIHFKKDLDGLWTTQGLHNWGHRE